MKKTDFAFKVEAAPQELIENGEENLKLCVSAFESDGSNMISDEFSSHFPELEEELDLGEVMEGQFFYYGDLTIEEMEKELRNRGFNILK